MMNLQLFTGITAIFLLAVTGAWLLRRQAAASRHLLWWLSALAVLLLPVVSSLKPVGSPAVLIIGTPVEVITIGPDEAPPPLPIEDILFAAWLVGAALMAARLIHGVVRSQMRRRQSVAAPFLHNHKRADVRLSDRIAVPETFGFYKPVVLLPSEAAQWSTERLQIVLAHEFIHIERRDWLTQCIAQIAACVYWFHPLAWLVLSQLRREGELACDDGVLRLGFKNSDYAQHLVDVARNVRFHREALAPSVAMATQSQLETRVRAILNPTKNRGNVTLMMKTAALSLTALAVFLLSPASSVAAGASRISGFIRDASTAMIPNATVTLSAPAGKSIVTQSNGAGEFAFSTVDPGPYTLEVKVPGFKPYRHLVSVESGVPMNFDIRLQVGTIQETVEVAGQTSRPVQTGNGSPQRIRVGGNVQAAKLVNRVLPEYPQHLKDAGIEGSVVLQAVISREGDVLNVTLLSPDVHPDLALVASEAVKQWKYAPTLLNGEPVEIVTMVNVNFTLSHKE